jgi:hypothetical protein
MTKQGATTTQNSPKTFYHLETKEDGTFAIWWYGKQLTSHEFAQITEELKRLQSLLESLNPYLRRPGKP